MRKIVIVVFPGVNLLDVAGPTQVFTTAAELLARSDPDACRAYQIALVSVAGGLVTTTSGIEVNSGPLETRDPEAIDTLLISGGDGAEGSSGADPRLISWLKAASPEVRRLGSICTGAFVLANAGLLDGRRAATHWGYCDRLQTNHPAIEVERDAIFVQDGGVWTSAGITSGIDLALAMVEEDWGRELALLVSRRLVVFLKRAGGQSQFSIPLQVQGAQGPLAKLISWVANNPAADHRVEKLAERAGKSERTLHRLFRESFGRSPADWVEEIRLEAARRLLEDTTEGLEQVAATTGFGSANTMRRAFLRHLRVGPSVYRERFHRESAIPSVALQMALHETECNGRRIDKCRREPGTNSGLTGGWVEC